MKLARREALTLSVAGIAAGLLAGRGPARATAKPRVRAVALDAFTTFDPRPVAALAERLFPGKGAALTSTWRTRQFEYSWLRTLMGRYAPFWQVTEEALVFAARMLGLELTADKRSQLSPRPISRWTDRVRPRPWRRVHPAADAARVRDPRPPVRVSKFLARQSLPAAWQREP